MARLLEKMHLKKRFSALGDPDIRRLALRRLQQASAGDVNDEGDRLADGLRHVGQTPDSDRVADAVSVLWIADILASRREAESRDPEPERGVGRVFMHGRSQAVRLPKQFRLPGDRVQVRSEGNTVVLEPLSTAVDAWFAEIDRYADVDFMADGRRQPSMPEDPLGFE